MCGMCVRVRVRVCAYSKECSVSNVQRSVEQTSLFEQCAQRPAVQPPLLSNSPLLSTSRQRRQL